MASQTDTKWSYRTKLYHYDKHIWLFTVQIKENLTAHFAPVQLSSCEISLWSHLYFLDLENLEVYNSACQEEIEFFFVSII